MAIDARMKRLWRHTIDRPGTIPVAVVRHNVAQMRRILVEECREMIARGEMTQQQFEALAHRIDAIWFPW
jgi:hypothetical protein